MSPSAQTHIANPDPKSATCLHGSYRYAETLVEDGFDSRDALECVDEADLMSYGVKRGHARLILKALAT